ncbi:sugar ABC transporter ATP-binding protein [Oceanobacillus sp. CFH 90083]|uniref:sugar ABC transporter ATP-binding protein n=1 Tax=Oceanobacillus sp. CFH 90083 TaxID=2592336 RepID=UPI00128DACA3|nr:sugar ABC transporter ATP-binding protein [Oceanobacillus sp. CFH 90083]
MSADYIIKMSNISKNFGGVKALINVPFEVKRGEIHALIGENGAGKSTLMKILAGAYQKNEGEVVIDGYEAPRTTTPKSMIKMGVSVIYQEFMLAPDLTVAENIYIDSMVEGGVFINWKSLKKKAKEQLERLGFGHIKPDAVVGELSIANQQIVEIAKCLARDSKILVFDEPTAVLTFSETEKLLSIIRQLKSEGVTIIYISHRLEELFEISDRITVLKDGKYVDTVITNEITKDALVSMMVGRELEQLFPERNAEIGEEVLIVDKLHAGEVVKEVSFSVKKGEVLGFSGLIGAGRTETMRAIFGADKIDSGKVVYFGENVRFKSPKEAIENGLGLVPEDRKQQGLLLEQSIRMNTTLAAMKKIKRFDIINHKREKKYAKELLESIRTKYGHIDHEANSLSGGNQQKIVLAKWLAADCKVMILDEPTRGVDVGAKTEIYKVINRLAESGVAVIVIASEMSEIIGLCDRAVVMRMGKVAGEVNKENLTEDNLIKLAMGV